MVVSMLKLLGRNLIKSLLSHKGVRGQLPQSPSVPTGVVI
jgi:hypothetical protein